MRKYSLMNWSEFYWHLFGGCSVDKNPSLNSFSDGSAGNAKQRCVTNGMDLLSPHLTCVLPTVSDGEISLKYKCALAAMVET